MRLWGRQLEIRSARTQVRVSLDRVRLREVVSAHSGLELTFEHRGQPCAVQVFDPEAQRALRTHPELLASPLLSTLRSRERRRRIGWIVGGGVLACVVLLPLILLLLFLWQADRIAGALAERIPVAHEQKLGRQVFAGMRARLNLREHGAAVELVQALGARLSAGSRFDYEFHVAEAKDINAFALPGGVIVVHTGLIDAVRRPEELASVLAHEVQHVELRHSLRAMIKELGLRGVWAALTGDVAGTVAGQAAMQLASLRFSRDAERQADAQGFDLLVKQDIDPRGMVDFFGTMAAGSAAEAPPAWLSTHPASEARQQRMRERLDALPARSFTALEPALWRQVQSR